MAGPFVHQLRLRTLAAAEWVQIKAVGRVLQLAPTPFAVPVDVCIDGQPTARPDPVVAGTPQPLDPETHPVLMPGATFVSEEPFSEVWVRLNTHARGGWQLDDAAPTFAELDPTAQGSTIGERSFPPDSNLLFLSGETAARFDGPGWNLHQLRLPAIITPSGDHQGKRRGYIADLATGSQVILSQLYDLVPQYLLAKFRRASLHLRLLRMSTAPTGVDQRMPYLQLQAPGYGSNARQLYMGEQLQQASNTARWVGARINLGDPCELMNNWTARDANAMLFNAGANATSVTQQLYAELVLDQGEPRAGVVEQADLQPYSAAFNQGTADRAMCLPAGPGAKLHIWAKATTNAVDFQLHDPSNLTDLSAATSTPFETVTCGADTAVHQVVDVGALDSVVIRPVMGASGTVNFTARVTS